MNRKRLYIAMTLVLPAFIAVGCGSNNTRSIAEENPIIKATEIQKENFQNKTEEVMLESKQPDTPTEVNRDESGDYKLAEIKEGEQEQTIESVNSKDESPQPDQVSIYFETNEINVKQRDYENLISHAEYLIKNPEIKLILTGHTDQSGNIEYNKKLAMKRSKSVAQVLIEYGVQAGQIITKSMGENAPLSGLEHTVYDRRVDIEYIQETQLTER